MIRKLVQNSIRLIPWSLRSSIRSFPIIAKLQRSLVANFLEGSEFVHVLDAGPAKGLKFPVLLPEDKNVWTGTYEIEFVSALANAVRRGVICFDVGGWRGYCGGVMAVNDADRVVIFEPLPSNVERIRRMLELNPTLPIQLVEAAVGASRGNAEFTVMEATSMGKLMSSPFQAELSGGHSISVEMVALDEWCERCSFPHPQVIKIDVEGAEVFVLEGARRILEMSKPLLFIEAHSRALVAEIVHLLTGYGYTISVLGTEVAPDGRTEAEVCHLVAR